MAKEDCSDFDLKVAELALWYAEDPKMRTIDQIVKRMNERFGVDQFTTNDVATAVTNYVRGKQSKAKDSIDKNIKSIEDQSKAVGVKTEHIEKIKQENTTGVYTNPNERTKRVQGETEKRLDEIIKNLDAIKTSNLKTQELQNIVQILDSGGNLQQAMRNPRFKTEMEKLWTHKSALAKQERKLADELIELNKMETELEKMKKPPKKKGAIPPSDADIQIREKRIANQKERMEAEKKRKAEMIKNNDLYNKLKSIYDGTYVPNKSNPKEQSELSKQLQDAISEAHAIQNLKQDIETLRQQTISKEYAEPVKRTPQQRSDEYRQLQAELTSLKDVRGEDKRKEQLRSKIEDMRQQIQSKEFRVPQSKKAREVDAEMRNLLRKKKALGMIIKHSISETKENMAWKSFKLVNGMFRSLGAAGDLPLLRQGGRGLVTHPIIAARATYKAVTKSWLEKHVNQYEASLEKDPDYNDMVEDGIVKPSEEGFEDMQLINKLGIFGYPFHVSSRQQHILLTEMRVQMYKTLKWSLSENGHITEHDRKELARFVLVATGVGQSKALEKMGALPSQVFFAHKYTLSRIQTVTDLGRFLLKSDMRNNSKMWKLYAGEYGKLIVAWAVFFGAVMLAAGAKPEDIELDPTSADFMQIRQGHTRIDLTFGMKSIIVPFFQTIYKQRKVSATGEVQEISRLKPTGDFLRKRLAPLPSTLLTQGAFEGKTVVGEDQRLGGADTIKTLANKTGLRTPKYGEKLEPGDPQAAVNLANGLLIAYSIPNALETMQDEATTGRFKFVAELANIASAGSSVYDAPGEESLEKEGKSLLLHKEVLKALNF